MPVDYSAPMPPLSQGVPFRDFILNMSDRFYMDSWRNCATQLGLQTGIDVEFLHLRGSSQGQGKMVVPFLSNHQTDLVNKCVSNWNDAIKQGFNPGIPHDEISVPCEIATRVFRDLNAEASYFDSQIHEDLGVEDYIVQRIVRGDRRSMNGVVFYHGVKMLMAATHRSRRDIIQEPTLDALAVEPKHVFVYESTQALEDQESAEPAKVYSFDQLQKATRALATLGRLWEEFGSARTRYQQLDIIVQIAEILDPSADINEEDIMVSAEYFYEQGLTLSIQQRGSRSKSRSIRGVRTYLPVLWAQEEEIRALVSSLIMHTNGDSQTRTFDAAASQQTGAITQKTIN